MQNENSEKGLFQHTDDKLRKFLNGRKIKKIKKSSGVKLDKKKEKKT